MLPTMAAAVKPLFQKTWPGSSPKAALLGMRPPLSQAGTHGWRDLATKQRQPRRAPPARKQYTQIMDLNNRHRKLYVNDMKIIIKICKLVRTLLPRKMPRDSMPKN
ncbi:hypothetical protein PWG14_25925 [Chromobacterium amazonense]|uniref:hypothetical protein n=1 Tax=Chromobacterium amazonense TaxID=1382803 RepID=UPI00237D6914|nr:hypothetical protein [Chromobacterium amazonense]MDE1715906.1 hypothetical protein [Chromobacterium amazonense]